MSGGGTGLMSGGGLSIGSIGRGKSGFGFCGCSIMTPNSCNVEADPVNLIPALAAPSAPPADDPFRGHGRSLHVQADRPHQRERVAVLDHSGTHAIVEDHLSVFQPSI